MESETESWHKGRRFLNFLQVHTEILFQDKHRYEIQHRILQAHIHAMEPFREKL